MLNHRIYARKKLSTVSQLSKDVMCIPLIWIRLKYKQVYVVQQIKKMKLIQLNGVIIHWVSTIDITFYLQIYKYCD